MNILFDKRDHELLRIVNDILSREQSFNYAKKLFYPFFHTRGIKEMAESKGLRIAYAVAHLLDTLEVGKVDERLTALKTLRNEVLNTTDSPLRINTARVLVQIMKELVRSHGDYRKQLELAHDFRTSASGKPNVIRRELKKYHLLEMPEQDNQVTFDDHVHDANTKGRKSSTHVIMDAWIKGIKRLRVIHYNYIQPKFAAELMEAAQIMGITVRIGIEFSAVFYNKYINLIWVPRGFPDSQSFLCFLAEAPVMAFMEEGRKVSLYRQHYILLLLKEFNEKHRFEINKRFEIEMPPINESAFLAFVGVGQASLVHLGKFIHMNLLPVMKDKVVYLQQLYDSAQKDEELKIERLIDEMNKIDDQAIVNDYLKPEHNPVICDPNMPPSDNRDVPELLRLNPKELIDRLLKLRSGYRITLNLTDINIEDAIEILYDCEGEITRLEIFNLKDYAAGKTDNIPPIAELQHAINTRNVITLKRIIKETILKVENSNIFNRDERAEKLRAILHDISTFRSFYNGTALISRIGSDSTGRAPRAHGMGLAIMETLPQKAQKEIRKNIGHKRLIIPIVIDVHLRKTYIRKEIRYQWLKFLLKFSFFQILTHHCHCIKDWDIDEYSTRMKPIGNIVTLGGVNENIDNQLELKKVKHEDKYSKISWKYLNTLLKNVLKVFIGFIPAFLTFFLTQDWWFLAYFGAFIWFGITGLRNIVQSVLGGGGLKRSPLLRWNDFVSWNKVTDSLLFTGLSIPLLDLFIKTIFLEKFTNITVATNPVTLYSVMALANGIYLSTHNAFRGLQNVAIYGNFFRSILSIPIAISLNAVIYDLMALNGAVNIDDTLQKSAAIISKAASDFVAGIIEGTADRYQNIKMRERDYNDQTSQLFNAYANLELLFPDTAVFELLESPQKLFKTSSSEVRDIETIITINALDLLYFWMYQPRARSAFRRLLRKLSEEEKQILISSQSVLQRTRKISYLFVDGIIGDNFSKALSFYLDCSKEYLEALEKMKSIKKD